MISSVVCNDIYTTRWQLHFNLFSSNDVTLNNSFNKIYLITNYCNIYKKILEKSSSSGFPLALSEWSFTIFSTTYNHKIKCAECATKQNISFFPFF